MNKLFKVLEQINTAILIVVFLQGLFWLVLACCCVYGINTNRDFMEMFFLIYFSEITIALLVITTQKIVDNKIELAKRILFEMEDEEYKLFSKFIANIIEGINKKDRWVKCPLSFLFKRLKGSSFLFDNIILAKCKKANINIKDLEVL